MSETFVSHSVEKTQQRAKEILAKLNGYNLLALYGELGSGKTTFVQGLAQALGVKTNVQSPTFTLVKEHRIESRSNLPAQAGKQEVSWKNLIHVDCYRVESAGDLKGVDLKEYWDDPDNLVVIEWAERVKNILPENRLDVCFEQTGEDQREITIFNHC